MGRGYVLGAGDRYVNEKWGMGVYREWGMNKDNLGRVW